jgi:hypothetical protein
VDKNLLRQTEIGNEPRLTMLETIREFDWKLSGAGELIQPGARTPLLPVVRGSR